jgi:hypothetical protein
VKCDHPNVRLVNVIKCNEEAISEFLGYRCNINDRLLVAELVSGETK